MRAVEIGQKPIVDVILTLVQIETAYRVIALAVDIANLKGCLPTNLAFDADIELIRTRHLHVRSIANTVPEIPEPGRYLPRTWVGTTNGGTPKAATVGKRAFSPPAVNCEVRPRVTREGVIRGPNELVVNETPAITTAKNSSPFSREQPARGTCSRI